MGKRMTMEIKATAIEQINIAYHAAEDRLMLKIGFSDDAELALWLTRRLVKDLWPLLQQEEPAQQVMQAEILTDELQDALRGSRQNKQGDLSGEYRARRTLHQNEILLVTDSQIVKSAHREAFLELRCSNDQTVKLLLTEPLTLALVNMLQLVAKETAWDLSLMGPAPILTAIQTSTVLH